MENVQFVGPRDRISNLPDYVSESILMCLPTRDAVRTSILSRKWRHVWTKLPQFVLDETFWENVDTKHSAEMTLTIVLNRLLLSHDGPINKFTLSNPELRSCPEIDTLIRFLAKSHLEDFTLEMWKGLYLLPSSFFFCDKLKHLRLVNCSILCPLASKGFIMLTTMVLIDVIVGAETLASLISGSPLLAALELSIASDIDICIDAPNLKTFIKYGWNNKSINFKRVPLLASVSMTTLGKVNFVGVGCNTIKFFQILPFIESLELSHHILLGFVDINHTRLATSLIFLKELKLKYISFNEIIYISFTFCLLRSSPNLKFIHIVFCDTGSNSEDTTTYMNGEDYSDICIDQLEEVKLEGVTGTKPELEFIRLLLAKSSSLKKLHIQPNADEDVNKKGHFKILKEVAKFRRISRDAEILFAE